MTTKELVLLCAGGTKGVLEIKEKDTLADVRIQIDKELDDDLIVPDFAYYVDGVRISQKQECKKLAWQVLDKIVSLRAKRSRYDLDHTATTTTTSMAISAKKVKVEDCDSNASQTNPPSSLNNTATATSTSALGMDVDIGVGTHPQSSLNNTSTCSSTSAIGMDVDFGVRTHPQSSLNNTAIFTSALGKDADVGVGTHPQSSLNNTSTCSSTSAIGMDVDFGVRTHPQSSLNNTATSTSASALGKDVDVGVRRIENFPTKPNPISVDAGNSRKVLNSVKSMLEENPQFCSIDRRNEWINEIEGILTMASPKTTVGVLGSTGVGKVSVSCTKVMVWLIEPSFDALICFCY